MAQQSSKPFLTRARKKQIRNTLLFMLSLTLFVLYFFPFVLVLINSFKERLDIVTNPLALPTTWSFANYIEAYQTMNFMSALWNSVLITTVSVLLIIVFSSMFATFL